MSDTLLREHRHRYNHRISERRRLGFPRIGHFDTWLIDQLQILVEENHGVDLYPGWSNSRDYDPTPETFGTVPLQSKVLDEAMALLNISAGTIAKLSGDKKYLAEQMGTKLPLLPVYGREECTLFSALALAQVHRQSPLTTTHHSPPLTTTRHHSQLTTTQVRPGSSTAAAIDFDVLSIQWCKHVDGINIFPKLPVHLRLHHSSWARSQRVKDAVEKLKPQMAHLNEVLQRHGPSSVTDAPRATAAAAASMAPPAHPTPVQPTQPTPAQPAQQSPQQQTPQQQTPQEQTPQQHVTPRHQPAAA